MLEIRDITLEYQDPKTHSSSLFQYNLKVAPGEWVAISGPSGVGKSSLLEAIAGLINIRSGGILWQGKAVDQLKPGQRPFAMLFQDHNLFEHLSLEQNLKLGAHPSGRLTPEQQQQLARWAQRLEIDPLLQRKPSEVSGGQRQRAALARALLRNAPVLLLDEPFNGLDRTLRFECMDWLLKLNQEESITLILTTHYPEELPSGAVRWLEMQPGGALVEKELPASVNPY